MPLNPETCRAAIAVADLCNSRDLHTLPIILTSLAGMAVAIWQGSRAQRYARLVDSLTLRNEAVAERADRAIEERNTAEAALAAERARWVVPTPKTGRSP